MGRDKKSKKPQNHPPRNVAPTKDEGTGKESVEIDDGGASGSSIPATLSITDVEGWSTEQLIQHLQARFPNKLIEEDFELFKMNRIEGSAFLTMTKEDFISCGMKFGPASLIASYIQKLKPQEVQAPKRKFKEDMLDSMRELVREEFNRIREDKKTVISISRMTQKHFTSLLDEHGLVRRTTKFDVTPTTKSVQPFSWGDGKEDAHAENYLGWLKSNINLPSDVGFCITSSKASLLNTTCASSKIDLKGTLDVAIVDSAYVQSGNLAGGMRIGIETKKTVNPDAHAMQVITELMVANIYSAYPVVMVLTDLKEHWMFFWLEPGFVVDCTFDLKESITLLETIVQEPDPPASQPDLGSPYLQRCKFRPAISQAGDVTSQAWRTPSGDTEFEGMERILRRPKVDIMSLLPEDDVANMRDVFDVMTPEEIHGWQMRRVLDFAMQTPAVQSSMGEEAWRSMYA